MTTDDGYQRQVAIAAAADEIQAAIRASDGEGATAAMSRLMQLSPEVGSRLLDQLIVAGLNRMVNGPDPTGKQEQG
ncbi:hypothetical protein AB0F17_65735 [Nonomuraea sp. NPDC026600]|uniref:hypothetical protein n=1 Tax=Nonomuraea sp. NPDC026600 TaxID=3155363 RepID=UPI0034051658